DVAGVLRDLHTSERGLTAAEAAYRQREAPRPARQHELVRALGAQLRSPLTLILAAGAGFSLVLGAAADVAMIGAMIVANAAIGAWQERQAGRAAEALAELGTATARVLRDGRPVTIPASAVVPGDIVLLAPGDRVAADARVVQAHGLEVDEAALTGESLPVAKAPAGGTAASRVVLEGSDVTVGTGRAAVVAVGERTRLGATAAALALDETTQSPLGQRLSRLLRQFLPLAIAGGALVVGGGVARGRPLGPALAIGGSLALAAVPEGLPLLAGVGEAGVARRLAGRQALVRRLAAVEALGRVDIACTDKTGTLTEGKLALRVVASPGREALLPGPLAPGLRHVLLTAALACPHPDAPDARAHPTDVAVVRGAEEAGLDGALRSPREAEAGFDPVRGFHAAVVEGRLRVKGAAEALAPRCAGVRRSGKDVALDDAGRAALLDRARRLAERGLRVLLVAEGPPDTPPADPQGLVALGFVGLSDPLRPGVPAAVRRCRDAGVRVMMLTGDHPATARTIAREAGLLDGRETDGEVLTGAEIAELENGDLDAALARAAVVARITPLDKVRIVESLRRQGHAVAMTGDGVNDAPALRLADVGVAMGRAGTEVARQAADVVLADDDFSTLVEALVEGRSFWRNVRRALGLLLGGNLGELGLMVGASALGLAPPLIARQILAVNVITDALPALAVALQPPEHRHLAGLAREGAAALDAPLRREVLRRGAATAFPSLAAYGLALGFAGPAQASTVAFASIVATQLAQTLDAGRTEDGLSRAVVGAVAGSTGLLVAALVAPPLSGLLGLAAPSPLGWLLIAGATGAAVPLGRALTVPAGVLARTRWFSAPALPAPAAAV
ncbi:MAG TPA: cation-transporting P-type ATPase, partial [Thermomicrobiales bacterium]|nr:cation-transporting P-type ATPase [Thermomicrobiales bacterium]